MWLIRAHEDRTGCYALKSEKVFSDKDIDYLNWYVENNLQLDNAKTGSAGEGRLTEYRKSNVAWLMPTDENVRYYFETISKYVVSANDRYFNYSLTGFDSIQYTVYPETVNGKYDWHTDAGDLYTTENWMRKLSVVVALNDDFDGGEFQTLSSDTPNTYKLNKGDMIL